MLKNALKFTRKGHIEIITAYDKATEMLEIHVADIGSGIKRDDIDKSSQCLEIFHA